MQHPHPHLQWVTFDFDEAIDSVSGYLGNAEVLSVGSRRLGGKRVLGVGFYWFGGSSLVEGVWGGVMGLGGGEWV